MAEPSLATTRLAATPALPPATIHLRDGSTLAVLAPRTYVRLQVARRHVGTLEDVRVRDLALPLAPGRCAGDDPAILWVAPDAWLLVAESSDDATLARDARAALGDRTGAAVDVSDALVTLELAGPALPTLLARGTGVDPASAALAPGRCTRTRFAQLAVLLRPRGTDRMELVVDRGPAAWLRDWLQDAAALL